MIKSRKYDNEMSKDRWCKGEGTVMKNSIMKDIRNDDEDERSK